MNSVDLFWRIALICTAKLTPESRLHLISEILQYLVTIGTPTALQPCTSLAISPAPSHKIPLKSGSIRPNPNKNLQNQLEFRKFDIQTLPMSY
ncbi:MAG: hypothetical protein K2G78_02675, partial [Muribaculaceae bacterium]|nr:hypothetical protein [Muribaculaceae bacterium]